MTDGETVAAAFKYNAAANEIDLIEAEKRLDSLLERRSKIAERSTFGLLALNGASAVVAFTALQSSRETLASIGITPTMVAFSLSAFLLGMILAVLSVWQETIHLTNTAGRQFQRTDVLRNIRKALSNKLHSDAIDHLGEELKKLDQVPPMDFAYSRVQLVMHNFSGGSWIAGIGYALWLIGRNINWCG